MATLTYPHLGHVHEAAANQGDGLVLQRSSQAVQLTLAHVPGSIPKIAGMVVGIASMAKFLKPDIPHILWPYDVGIQSLR